MKKTVQFTVAMAILFVSTTNFANGPKKTFNEKALTNNGIVKNLIDVEVDPTFKRKGDKLFLNLLNLDQEKVVIKVYDSQNRLVFSEVVKGNLVIERAFNFESAQKDDYTVVVIDNKTAFEEKIAVK